MSWALFVHKDFLFWRKSFLVMVPIWYHNFDKLIGLIHQLVIETNSEQARKAIEHGKSDIGIK